MPFINEGDHSLGCDMAKSHSKDQRPIRPVLTAGIEISPYTSEPSKAAAQVGKKYEAVYKSASL